MEKWRFHLLKHDQKTTMNSNILDQLVEMPLYDVTSKRLGWGWGVINRQRRIFSFIYLHKTDTFFRKSTVMDTNNFVETIRVKFCAEGRGLNLNLVGMK